MALLSWARTIIALANRPNETACVSAKWPVIAALVDLLMKASSIASIEFYFQRSGESFTWNKYIIRLKFKYLIINYIGSNKTYGKIEIYGMQYIKMREWHLRRALNQPEYYY
jgi:hypothetical protein